MDFVALVDQVIALLRQRGRVTYRTLQRQFQLDAEALADLLGELRYAHQEALREDEQGLMWTDEARPTPPAPARPAASGAQTPLTYTPAYLAEQILTSRSALEGERKQVTVLFADIKDSTELIRDLDPEAAQQLLDPALHAMMAAVHRYEGTVNQVLGDGIMALFGAPLAHEDHALRACYAALTMQTAMREYTETMRRAHGIEMRIRVGLNSGEVVVRAIGNDLHMDYSAVGQTTHLAARMEQLAAPGTIRLTAATLRLVEGLVQVQALGPIPVRGIPEPVEVFELIGASTLRGRLQAAAVRGLTHFVGCVADAVPLLTQALERTIATEIVDYQALCHLALGEAHLLAGRLEEAHAFTERALEFALQYPGRGYQAYALRLLGEIAAHRAPPDVDEAAAHYLQALALAEGLGMRRLTAHCHLGLGILYQRVGKREPARAVLSTAIELLRAMEMTFWLPRAEAALAKVA
jgi:class 3 adenylate cyclase